MTAVNEGSACLACLHAQCPCLRAENTRFLEFYTENLMPTSRETCVLQCFKGSFRYHYTVV
jgi:hypothetical protein